MNKEQKEQQSQLMPEQKLKPIMITFISLAHVGAIYGLYLFVSGQIALSTALLGLIFFYINDFGVTAGMHRLWSHRSYTAKTPFRIFLMICAAIANQGSIYHWVRDHRIHHKFSEKPSDPHNAHLGFFYSHMGWLMVEKNKMTIEEGKKLNLEDLHQDPVVMWEKRMHPWFDLFACFMLPGLICMAFGDTYWNGVFFAGFFRYVFALHVTWLVNSAAHMWGEKPYDQNIGPCENPTVAVLTGGEGWHNWHHTFPFDYATAEFGALMQWNPTKLLIDFGALIGQVTNRRRAKWNGKTKKLENQSTNESENLGY